MDESEPSLDSVVAEINRLYQVGSLKTAVKIGQHVIAHVFGGDGARALDTKRHPQSFLALSQRKDLKMKRMFLYYCVVVAEQIRFLPADVADVLPLSHHKLLLPIKDAARKAAMAQRSVAAGWTTLQLREAVRCAQSEQSQRPLSRARPAPPPFARAAQALTKVLDLLSESRDDAADISRFGCADSSVAVEHLRKAARTILSRCSKLDAVIEALCVDVLGSD